MLNTGVFSSWMVIIGKRIGQEFDAPVLNAYRASFDRAGMSDAEFIAAATLIFENWKGFGLPAPAEFLRYARPQLAPQSEAVAALNRVQSAIGKGDPADLSDPRVLAAWRAVGGASSIRNASERDWPFLEKRWVTAFTEDQEFTERRQESLDRIERAERNLGAGNGRTQHIGDVVQRALPAEAKR